MLVTIKAAVLLYGGLTCLADWPVDLQIPLLPPVHCCSFNISRSQTSPPAPLPPPLPQIHPSPTIILPDSTNHHAANLPNGTGETFSPGTDTHVFKPVHFSKLTRVKESLPLYVCSYWRQV